MGVRSRWTSGQAPMRSMPEPDWPEYWAWAAQAVASTPVFCLKRSRTLGWAALRAVMGVLKVSTQATWVSTLVRVLKTSQVASLALLLESMCQPWAQKRPDMLRPGPE